MNITEFLLARIAEDQAMAAEMAENAQDVADCNEPHNAEIWTTSGVIDPARVLAECEAKREIVEDYEWAVRDDRTERSEISAVRRHAATLALARIAAVYGDHPDYDPAWRP